jgi:hypothetical protein
MTSYYTLYIQCPACLHEGKRPGPASNWYHVDCGGTLEIGDDAYYRCKKCRYTSHVRYWRYSCRDHSSSFRATSSNHFASAVSITSQLSHIDRRWLYTLLENLEDW